MDISLQIFLSWQFILFCLGIVALTKVFRQSIEFFILDNPKLPGNKTSKFWRDFILPISPVLFGVIIAAVAPQYPYPEGIMTVSARVFFGLVGGLLSTLIYRVVVGLLKNKLHNLDELEQLSKEVSQTIVKE